MNNINFINNKSKYFGGAIYSKYKYLYTLNINNTKFIKNYAGVAGGALFSPNLPQYNLFNYKNCEFVSNTAESHGNDFATNPYIIKLLNEDKYNDVILKTGSYLPIIFSIYDSFENLIQDQYKYYSDISVKVAVENKNNQNTVSILNGNIGSFING